MPMTPTPAQSTIISQVEYSKILVTVSPCIHSSPNSNFFPSQPQSYGLTRTCYLPTLQILQSIMSFANLTYTHTHIRHLFEKLALASQSSYDKDQSYRYRSQHPGWSSAQPSLQSHVYLYPPCFPYSTLAFLGFDCFLPHHPQSCHTDFVHNVTFSQFALSSSYSSIIYSWVHVLFFRALISV